MGCILDWAGVDEDAEKLGIKARHAEISDNVLRYQ